MAGAGSSIRGWLMEVWYMAEKNEEHGTTEVSLPPEVKLLQEVTPPFFPEGGSSMTILVEYRPSRSTSARGRQI